MQGPEFHLQYLKKLNKNEYWQLTCFREQISDQVHKAYQTGTYAGTPQLAGPYEAGYPIWCGLGPQHPTSCKQRHLLVCAVSTAAPNPRLMLAGTEYLDVNTQDGGRAPLHLVMAKRQEKQVDTSMF